MKPVPIAVLLSLPIAKKTNLVLKVGQYKQAEQGVDLEKKCVSKLAFFVGLFGSS